MRATLQKLVQHPFFLFNILATLFVWVFIWRHAYVMDIVYDEASSFRFLKTGHYRALPGIANTHWLNSFFIRLFMTFNESVLCLRLHAVLAFPFYAFGIYRLAMLIKSGGAQLAFYCLLVFNPYVLDFFAMARGYGLAITLQVWTILYFIKAVQTTFSYRLWLHVFILSLFTIGANLSYQYTVMTLTGGYLLYCGLTAGPFSWYTNKQKRKITGLFVLLLFFSTLDLLFIKYYGKDLEFGGTENFVRSVFNTLWVKSLYNASYTSISVWLSWCTFLLIIMAGVYFIRKTIQQKKGSPGMAATFITIGIFLLGMLFHLVFHTPYISNRTALQWYAPGLFTLFMAMAEWHLPVKTFRLIGYGAGGLTGMLVLIHFVTVYNDQRCIEYYEEDPTRQPLHDLYARHPKHPGASIWIAGTYNSYYSLVDRPTPPATLFEEYPNQPLTPQAIQTLDESDYILTHTNATTRFLDSTHTHYTIINTYAHSDFKIIKLYH